MQLSFGDAEEMGKCKRTRREIFLAEMEQVVPWAELLAVIAPHYPKFGKRGRPPYPLETMLRLHLASCSDYPWAYFGGSRDGTQKGNSWPFVLVEESVWSFRSQV